MWQSVVIHRDVFRFLLVCKEALVNICEVDYNGLIDLKLSFFLHSFRLHHHDEALVPIPGLYLLLGGLVYRKDQRFFYLIDIEMVGAQQILHLPHEKEVLGNIVLFLWNFHRYTGHEIRHNSRKTHATTPEYRDEIVNLSQNYNNMRNYHATTTRYLIHDGVMIRFYRLARRLYEYGHC